MKSFAVFVEKPPKNGENTRYCAMEVDYTETDEDVEKRIAAYINENRINPLPAGLTNYAIYTADTAQEAANQARDDGLCFKSKDEMLRIKADAANAAKFGTKPRKDIPDPFAEARDAFDFFGMKSPF